MVAYLEGLFPANYSNTTRSIASPVLAASESDKDGQVWAKNKFFTFRHSGAMETAHWAYLFALMDSPCIQLVCLRRASPALSLPCSYKLSIKRTENDEVNIPAGEPNEQGD